MASQLGFSFPVEATATVEVGLGYDLARLQASLGKLSPRDQTFASDLIYAYRRYGRLSERQLPWVATLLAKTLPASSAGPVGASVASTSAVSLGEFSGVLELFRVARLKLKFPKVRLDLDGVAIILSVAGERSSNPGYINIAGEGQYPNREWFGRVSPSGVWEPSRALLSDSARLAKLTALLVEFGRTPAAVAKAYGLLTGNCCFCGRALSDERSTSAGFGPVCAESYGLSEQWARAADSNNMLAFEGGIS